MSIVVCHLALLIVIIIIAMVIRAYNMEPISLPDLKSKEILKTKEKCDLEIFYKAGIDTYNQTEKDIWQIATIFSSVSLVIMGWVVTSLEKMNYTMIILSASASVVLVGIATLFKFRLRQFNLVHIFYLQRLEEKMLGSKELAQDLGLHEVRKVLKTENKFFVKIFSIHGIINLYFWLFLFIWIGICIFAMPKQGLSLPNDKPALQVIIDSKAVGSLTTEMHQCTTDSICCQQTHRIKQQNEMRDTIH